MKEYLDKLDKFLSLYLVKKAPALPENTKDILTKIAPYFAILGVILGIPAVLAVFGLAAFIPPFAAIAGARTGIFWFFWLVALAQVVIAFLSIKPLFARRLDGWQLLLYSQLLSLVTSLRFVNLGNLLVIVISFYLLYQVKSKYTK